MNNSKKAAAKTLLSALCLLMVGCSEPQSFKSGVYLNQSITDEQDYAEIIASPGNAIIIDTGKIRISAMSSHEFARYERLLQGENGKIIIDGLTRCLSCDIGQWPKGSRVEFVPSFK